jgi:hypothetical protein
MPTAETVADAIGNTVRRLGTASDGTDLLPVRQVA